MSLPSDIEFFVNDEGAYIEVESLIQFLKSDENIPPEYATEARHLKKLAAYLETQLAEILAQKKLMSEVFDTEKPN